MMPNTWFVSDTHFGHEKMLTFTDGEGNLMRNFSSIEEMNEHMILKWNSVVRPEDTVIHLGDVTHKLHEGFKEISERLNGTKRLILGNHDIVSDMIGHFVSINVTRVYRKHGFIVSHYPLHPETCFDPDTQTRLINVHGHTHVSDLKDVGYVNISVEKTKYTPLSFTSILKLVEKERIRLNNV